MSRLVSMTQLPSENEPSTPVQPPSTPSNSPASNPPLVPPTYAPPQGGGYAPQGPVQPPQGAVQPPVQPPQPPVQPPYPGQGYPPPGAPKPPTNVFAIVALVGVFIISLGGIIFGHIALSQIKKTGESGRGMALAATIIGYVRLGIEILVTIIVITAFGFLGLFAASIPDEIDSNFDSLEEQFDGFTDEGDSSDIDMSDMEWPWSGTENDAFCSALDDYDLLFDDELAYYEQLLEVTEDPDFKALIEEQIYFFDADVVELSDEEFDAYLESTTAWSEAHVEMTEMCWGEY